jgi:ABC-type dipeptide/oligopeptide/nickel transport system ATPase component
MTLLSIENLNVAFNTSYESFQALKDITFILEKNETLSLVGESGSGKSTIANAIIQLLPENISSNGQIIFEGKNLCSLSSEELRQIRGNKMGMVFQEPQTALNPTMRVGKQVLETLYAHHRISKKEALDKVYEVLYHVGFQSPKEIYPLYPFQLSGGMRQRVVIAIAIVNNPILLIADEPTTALDAELRNQILDLLKSLQQKMHMALLLISHDLKLVAKYSDRVAVLQNGRMVEMASSSQLFQIPQHDYTKQLLNTCVYKRETICSK